MQADLPHTLYNRKKKGAKGKVSKEFKVDKNDKAFTLQEQANKKAAMRRAQESGIYTTEQLFE